MHLDVRLYMSLRHVLKTCVDLAKEGLRLICSDTCMEHVLERALGHVFGHVLRHGF